HDTIFVNADKIPKDATVKSFTLHAHKATGDSSGKIDTTTSETQVVNSNRVSASISVFRCRNCFSATHDEGLPTWNVVATGEDVIILDVEVNDGGKPLVRSCLITLKRRPFGLEYSGGFGFFGTRDERASIEPGTNNQPGTLIRHDRENWSQQATLLAHFVSYEFPYLAASLGLATKVPSDDLPVALGVSIILRELPFDNSLYLTFGGAYAKQERIAKQYRSGSVPAGTDSAALLESRHGIVPFVSISIGFWGSASKFSGRNPVNGGDTSK
ncbi:MAG: hypothetical protein QOJ16_4446, partial [Acidobacteriota bacterium]|nr:hypothetical protein [Acidobacteriota bacterium]